MKTIKDNILNCSEDIIIHQTNCRGVMGSGLALQIKVEYPEVFNGYFSYCKSMLPSELLGTSLICEANNGKYIANVFGQLNYGEGLQTDYDKLETALKEVKAFAIDNNLSVAVPHSIGCGFGGGDWKIVSKMVRRIFNKIPCNIYQLPKTTNKKEV